MIPNGHITIYNRYFVSRVETYQRTVIKNVVWEATKAVSGRSTGVLASNVATVFIPMQRGADYLKPKAWQALVTKTGNWTLQEGDVIADPERQTTHQEAQPENDFNCETPARLRLRRAFMPTTCAKHRRAGCAGRTSHRHHQC